MTKIEEKVKKINCLAECLRVAGEGSRIKMLCALFSRKKVCVSDMAKELDMSVAITSHHFKELTKAGLVDCERSGKEVCYFVAKTPLVSDLKRFICRHK